MEDRFAGSGVELDIESRRAQKKAQTVKESESTAETIPETPNARMRPVDRENVRPSRETGR